MLGKHGVCSERGGFCWIRNMEQGVTTVACLELLRGACSVVRWSSRSDGVGHERVSFEMLTRLSCSWLPHREGWLFDRL